MTSILTSDDMVGRYDKLAANYDKLHQRWLRHAGGEAQAALEALVRALATPDKSFLDAGCGTGEMTRRLIAEGLSSDRITLLDPSQAMLGHCADIPATKVHGRLEALPFQDGIFDIVTCVWALETVTNPNLALAELCRVVRPGGVLCLTFCADMPARGLADSLMRRALIYRDTGRLLSDSQVIGTIEGFTGFKVRAIPTKGPAVTLLAKRTAAVHESDRRSRKRGSQL